MKKVYVYKQFERFWHWTQALVILFLALTGFEIHSSYELFGFQNAVAWHNAAGWGFLVLIVFAIFWHFTTGEWRQYIPTTRFLVAQVNYYVLGIFRNAPHPTKKTVYNKFNPLQRLIYLGLKILVIPIQVVSGFVYLYYIYPNSPFQVSGLESVAYVHTAGAFALIAFVIAHVYLTTTGHTPTASIKAMITGWEELEVDEEEEGYMQETISNSAAGYYYMDLDGVLRNVNQAWLKLYKYENKGEILGKHFSVTRSKEEQNPLRNITEEVMKEGKSVSNFEVKRLNKDGSEGYHLLTANPVYANNEIIGMEGFIVDTTERHQSEEMLKERQQELEKLLAERDDKESDKE